MGFKIELIIATQQFLVYENDSLVREYSISTATRGPGEQHGSFMTPRGRHIIRAKIGANCPVNTVFIGRRPTGEIYTPEMKKLSPERDWILTRILWLSGLEVGKNRLGQVDTMRRCVYIHGTGDDVPMGIPGSKGCIRMRNSDLIELYDFIPVQTPLLIRE